MADPKEKESGVGDYFLMGALGLFAIAIIAVVIVSMTKKPKLNDENEKPTTKIDDPSVKLDTSETDADPQGHFSLDDAQRAVPGHGGFVATIHTSKGDLTCALYDDRAPNTVANFVGLATGARAWKDPKKGKWVHRPAYDGTPFHRVIKGFMIQGGDPLGNGTGEPGYTINDEIWPGARHDRAGLLSMANRGPNTNGAQFFIQDAPAAHLDNSYTIFGDCSPIETIHDIANGAVVGDRPTSPVTIESIRIRRAN